MTHHVICGDSLHVLPTLDAESVDAIVCDPPYGLSFMGKEWDHGVPGEAFWREALRVAKPGAHLLAFGGTRTYHRLACAIEDAGWEIRDCLSWLYGSGFPKSLDVSKAMDKAAGAERKAIAPVAVPARNRDGTAALGGSWQDAPMITAPATDLARQWQGWGTALKPAWEPIILARKPLVGTVASNVAQYGTGAVNVDGCRIGFASDADEAESKGKNQHTRYANPNSNRDSYSGNMPTRTDYNASGRWPANVVLDEDAAAMLDAQTGIHKSGVAGKRNTQNGYGGGWGPINHIQGGYGDTGGASRFFYTAKASRREREAGLEGMPERVAQKWNSGGIAAHRAETAQPLANVHPTVKPIALMRWLCRLVTPPNGLVLDPFTGSGSTGCAAALEGFRFVGIEREPEYADIARRRIAHWAGASPSEIATLDATDDDAAEDMRREKTPVQHDLFI